MRDLLDVILEPGGLTAHFQPIFEIIDGERRVHSYESLMRGPKGTNIERADILFEYVRRKRQEGVVDRACVATALRAAQDLPGSPRLCLNVHASTLGRDSEFASFLAREAEGASIRREQLTVEIVEHSPSWDGPAFLSSLDALRTLGVRIALDDVGLGQSNYRMILDCRPDYFKMDRYFVQGVHADFYRQAVIESVAKLARRFLARVVAEGVEQEEDLETVLAMGIDLIQGHLFAAAAPSAAWHESGRSGVVLDRG